MRGNRIVLAEDDAALALVIEEALQEVGVRSKIASDGRMALTLLREDPAIPLLLTDIRMPGMNGYELVRRTLAEFPELKVVMMTGYAAENPPDEILRAREFRFLRKPFELELLQALILDMFSRP